MATSSTGPNVGLGSPQVAYKSYPVAASTTINQSAAVCIDSSGNANPGADTSGFVYIGIARLGANNSSGAAGAVNVDVEINLRYRQFNAVSPSAASWLGKRVFLSDDTVVLAGSSSNKVIVGTVVSVDNTSAAGIVTVDQYAKFALATT